jgi:hypothetical protein
MASAAARRGLHRSRERPVIDLELSEALGAAVARIHVEHDQARECAGDDSHVCPGPATEPAIDLRRGCTPTLEFEPG